MQIIEKKLTDIIPYEKNPRKNDAAVQYVANSIKQFGFKVPIVIDKNGVIVAGHTRHKAANKLGMETVPCIIADDLSEEQIKAFRIADNKVSEQAEWDEALLMDEIEDLIEFDMTDYGFDFVDIFDIEEEHKKNADDTQNRVENIENLALGQFDGEGYYDIPKLKPVYELPEIKEWIGFNYVLSDEDPTGKGVHFFIDDYQFERIWSNPEKYVEKLKQYAAVATPDFSPYGDMPNALQIYNHYRKHWVGAFLQERGVKVIPTIRCSSDRRSLDWYLDGEPHGGIVIISSMWVNDEKKDRVLEEYTKMYETLKPAKVIIYGKKVDWLYGNVEYIPNFTQKRWGENNG
ncbi:MAG: DUF4417 domain-containing protein [Prevotella sp.]|nr:DUF4417 domain-containing protein [Candidatus Prevotella equi]